MNVLNCTSVLSTCKVYLLGVPEGSLGLPNFFFLGIVDLGHPVPMAQESGTGLGTMSNSSSSLGVTGDIGAVISTSLSIKLYQ